MTTELGIADLPAVLEVADDARAERLERQVAGLHRQLTFRIAALGQTRTECDALRSEAEALRTEVGTLRSNLERTETELERLRYELEGLTVAHALLLSTRTLRWARRPRTAYAAARKLAHQARSAIDR